MKVDPKWHKKQINEFRKERQVYEQYTKLIQMMLKKILKNKSMIGFVEGRAKSVASFAEKAVRKAHKYENPVEQLTDLCGARAILQTTREVKSVCESIRASFIIDAPNSLDVSTRLREMEFGYLSYHYVVQLDKRKVLELLKPDNPEEEKTLLAMIEQIGDRKAEIQVKTLLQHAWADISHDRIYKTQIKVPQQLKRESGRIAALLEDADHAFLRFVEGIDRYNINYISNMPMDELKAEIEVLNLITDYDKKNTGLLHKLALHLMAINDWDRLISVAEEYSFRFLDNSLLLLDYGIALIKSGNKKEGRELLIQAAKLDPKNPDILYELGESWREEDPEKALTCFEKAYKISPNEPKILKSYLISRIEKNNGDLSFLPLITPNLIKGISICRERYEANTYIPYAYYDIGKALIFLKEPNEALIYFAKAIHSSTNPEQIQNEINTIKWLKDKIVKAPAGIKNGLEWSYRLLELGYIIKLQHIKREAEEDEKVKNLEFINLEVKLNDAKAKAKPKTEIDDIIAKLKEAEKSKRIAREKHNKAETMALDALNKVSDFVSKDCNLTNLSKKIEGNVCIVAGVCSEMFESEKDKIKEIITNTFKDFEGTIISGGTMTGISGFVGELSSGNIIKIGYVPEKINKKMLHSNYREIRKTCGAEDFSVMEPLQYWFDLIYSGYKPWQICLLGINGGVISKFEYCLALIFGAQTALLENSGGAASKILVDNLWKDFSNLTALIDDKNTVKVFIELISQQIDPIFKNKNELEKAARAIHENYLRENSHLKSDSNLVTWENLRDDFKRSNEDQAQFAATILKRHGYEIRTATNKTLIIPNDYEVNIENMAEMEHGRWNIERLKEGWKYGAKKDTIKRISPYLVAWDKLKDDIKKYDLEAVKNFPQILFDAGFEIVNRK